MTGALATNMRLALAAGEGFDLSKIGEGFRNYGGPTAAIVGLIVIVIFVGLLVYAASRRGAKREQSHPARDLFRKLCEMHGLDGQSRKLLLTIAQQARLEEKAEVFVRPSLFAKAAEGLIADGDKSATREALAELAGRIYGRTDSE